MKTKRPHTKAISCVLHKLLNDKAHIEYNSMFSLLILTVTPLINNYSHLEISVTYMIVVLETDTHIFMNV